MLALMGKAVLWLAVLAGIACVAQHYVAPWLRP